MGCEHSVPVATADDFQYVHPMPAMLLDNTIYPGQAPGQLYHLKMQRNLWRLPLSTDSFGVRYTDGRPFEANVEGVTFSFRNKMILRNSRFEPIGVMIKQWGRFEKTFKIFGFKPFYVGQPPSGEFHDDGRPLFTWAECVDKAFSVRYTMRTGDGATFVADRVGKVMGKMQMKLSRDGRACAMIVHEPNFLSFRGPVWDLQIAPGIDPCMIICFTAIVDEILAIEEEERRRQQEMEERNRMCADRCNNNFGPGMPMNTGFGPNTGFTSVGTGFNTGGFSGGVSMGI